jgi:hypothetical protein
MRHRLEVTSGGAIVKGEAMRLIRSMVVGFMLVAATAVPALAQQDTFPEVIELPDGFFPEGIAVGYGNTAYTGSLVDGAIWRADLRRGTGELLVPGVDGTVAVGMDFDRRSGHLFVSGGDGQQARIYDTATGELRHTIDLAGAGFVNDVIVTRTAAYFTDSFVPVLYQVPLGPGGEVTGAATVIPLGGDFRFEPGQFNANGIEATPSGGTLYVVNSFFGEIHTVDPSTGMTSLIDLGGAVVNGDGLVLLGDTLYAVVGGANQITEIALARDHSSGEVVGALTSDAFDVPTTAARHGQSLYAVNAKFSTPPLPTTPYEIVSVER